MANIARISHHCFACQIENHLIFLDAKKGTYTLLSPDEASQVLPHIERSDNQDVAPVPITNRSPIFEKLLKENKITLDKENGKPLNNLDHMRPRRELLGTGYLFPPKIYLLDIIYFLHSVIRGIIIWKILPFRAIYTLQRHASNNLSSLINTSPRRDINHIVEKYFHMAVFFYTMKNRCFLNSLSMMYFLRNYGFDAYWVFAVEVEPFQAHCWTQVGDYAIGEHLFSLQHFRPIMII